VAALYEQALELDPSSVRAMAGLAEALLDRGLPSSDDPTEPARIRRADALITRAEQLRPDDIQVMFNRMYLLGRQDRCPEAIPAAQRAISAHPISAIEQSIRTNPRNSQIHFRYRLMGFALLFLDRYDEACRTPITRRRHPPQCLARASSETRSWLHWSKYAGR
jgi:tetratricopeptide (TPR) repeat protein